MTKPFCNGSFLRLLSDLALGQTCNLPFKIQGAEESSMADGGWWGGRVTCPTERPMAVIHPSSHPSASNGGRHRQTATDRPPLDGKSNPLNGNRVSLCPHSSLEPVLRITQAHSGSVRHVQLCAMKLSTVRPVTLPAPLSPIHTLCHSRTAFDCAFNHFQLDSTEV